MKQTRARAGATNIKRCRQPRLLAIRLRDALSERLDLFLLNQRNRATAEACASHPRPVASGMRLSAFDDVIQRVVRNLKIIAQTRVTRVE